MGTQHGLGTKGKHAYHNESGDLIYLTEEEIIPEGFIKGTGIKRTAEVKERISTSMKLQWQNEEYKLHQSEIHKFTEEEIKNGVHKYHWGKVCISDGVTNKYIDKEDIINYPGWEFTNCRKNKPATVPAWNKGLTKELDARVYKNAVATAKGLLGNIPWNKGLTKETDERVKLSAEKQIGKIIAEETRRKISKINTGRVKTAESIAKLSASLKLYWKTHPEVLVAKGQKLKEYYSQPGTRELASSRTKEAHKKDPTIVQRINATRRKNKTFNTSKEEIEYYTLLLTKYTKDDIFLNYDEDPRYPFRCDFYIKSEDLFIELNLHPTHGTHPFDPTNEEDILLLEEFIKRDDKWSRNIIKVWTQRDYLKIQTAINNNLNYKVIYYNEYRDEIEHFN